MSWVRVPLRDEFQISYAGNPPIIYRPDQDGVLEVEDRHLEEFRASIAGTELVPAPEQSAEPAQGEE